MVLQNDDKNTVINIASKEEKNHICDNKPFLLQVHCPYYTALPDKQVCTTVNKTASAAFFCFPAAKGNVV